MKEQFKMFSLAKQKGLRRPHQTFTMELFAKIINFLVVIINYFRKNAPLQLFKTPLQSG